MTSAFSIGDRLEIQELTARHAWSLGTDDEDASVECFRRDGELVWDVFDGQSRPGDTTTSAT
jgi:hypothetical protein